MRKGMQVALLAFVAMTAHAPAVFAEDGCFTSFGKCMERAAAIDSFWWRWAAGLDCELDLVECARVKLIGT